MTRTRTLLPKLHEIVEVRWMDVRRDAIPAMDIPAGKWQPPLTAEEIENAIARTRNGVVLVAELVADRGAFRSPDRTLVGVCVYYLLPQSIHLTHLAVSAEHRRRGVASMFLRGLKAKIDGKRYRFLIAVTHECDVDAQKFFVAQEPVAVRLVRGACGERGERDGVRFVFGRRGPVEQTDDREVTECG